MKQKKMKSFCRVVLLSTFLPRIVDGVGRVPDGNHTSVAYEADTIEDGLEVCDRTVSSAGLTYRVFNEDDPTTIVYFHAFLPPLLNETDEAGWTTYRSKKTFVFHPGNLLSKDILDLDADVTAMSLPEVEQLCVEHPDCVGFTYPVHSTQMNGFVNVTFASSIDGFSHLDGDDWRTFLVNEESKSNKVNINVATYDAAHMQKPYSSCCNRAVFNGTTETPILPSIEDVQRMDTTPRIPCNISKEEFQAKYEFRRTPVILVGCDTDWPAKTRWNFEDLIHRFEPESLWCSKTGYSSNIFVTKTWGEIAYEIANEKPFFVFDTLEHSAGESLESDYSTPPPFEDTDLYADGDDEPYFTILRWFCLASKYTGTMPHEDPHATDAWNSLVVGHKWWVLFPPVVGEDAMECDADCSPEYPELSDWYASVAVNAARAQYGAAYTPLHILQKPGETIYVPYEIVHSVFNMDDTIAVTANYASPGGSTRGNGKDVERIVL